MGATRGGATWAGRLTGAGYPWRPADRDADLAYLALRLFAAGARTCSAPARVQEVPGAVRYQLANLPASERTAHPCVDRLENQGLSREHLAAAGAITGWQGSWTRGSTRRG